MLVHSFFFKTHLIWIPESTIQRANKQRDFTASTTFVTITSWNLSRKWTSGSKGGDWRKGVGSCLDFLQQFSGPSYRKPAHNCSPKQNGRGRTLNDPPALLDWESNNPQIILGDCSVLKDFMCILNKETGAGQVYQVIQPKAAQETTS